VLPVERFDPLVVFLSGNVLSAFFQRATFFLSMFLHPGMVIAGQGTKEIFAQTPVDLPSFVEEPNDGGWPLEVLNVGVQEDTIKAGVDKANALIVMFQETIHGGAPSMRKHGDGGGPPFYLCCPSRTTTGRRLSLSFE
jgi:hypothetical protein